MTIRPRVAASLQLLLAGARPPARFQRQLGIRRYDTAWLMLHELRRATVNAVREPLHGEVELDDAWVGGPQPGLRGSRQLKGRKAALVAVAVEKRGKGTGRARMEVIPDFSRATLTDFAKRHITPGAKIYTDGLKQFSGLPEAGYRHVARRNGFGKGADLCCRVHTERSATCNSG